MTQADVYNFLVNFERRWTTVQLDLPTRNNHSFEVSVTNRRERRVRHVFRIRIDFAKRRVGCYRGKLAGEKITMYE